MLAEWSSTGVIFVSGADIEMRSLPLRGVDALRELLRGVDALREPFFEHIYLSPVALAF
jgi:hypothetical protein